MNSKFGMFSVLVLGIMMLLIPVSSLANAQEYDQYYENEQYKKDNKSDEPVIIIKNEPIQKKEKKEKKEHPMLLVKKDVLYCDRLTNSTGTNCGFPIPGPYSDRYVQECTTNNFLCNTIDEAAFDMIVTDNIEFPGSEDGKKITFNGERFTVTEDANIGEIRQIEGVNSVCQEIGFDGGFELAGFIMCTLNEGECSGIIQDGELKECTIKNYVAITSD